ncbi:MAG TPA: hypothetical protein VH763_13585 [Gemmatimonadales bacterium]|jgi:hypothetical protein
MTYTFKLARRLAVSRDFVMLSLLVLLAACSGDTTSPDTRSSTPAQAVPFEVVPRSITIEANQRIQFRGQLQDSSGGMIPAQVTWHATGGTIDSTGTFWSSNPGTYTIIARRYWGPAVEVNQSKGGKKASDSRRAWRDHPVAVDSSVVEVVPTIKRIAISPKPVRMSTGAARTFTATGFLSDDSAITLAVAWSATGGAIDASGTYTAGNTAGLFHVIAANAAGTLADTAAVVLRGPTPGPSAPRHQLASAVLKPGPRTVTIGSKLQYRAYGLTKSGDSVSIAVAFSATGGTISPTGLFTAGSKAGTFKVIARDTVSRLADTTKVTVALASSSASPNPVPSTTPVHPPVGTAPDFPIGHGVPFGAFAGKSGNVESATTIPFTLTMEPFDASSIVARINRARASGLRMMIAMTSGKHEQYKTGGVFDMSKWLAKMNTYDKPAIKAAIAAGVADGTIIGNSVMDEPHNTYTPNGNSWGPAGTMTKARVDQMCAYVKEMFPTLPAGVVHDHNAFEPTKSYRVCDFIVAQYAWRKTKGDIAKFRDDALALGRRDGIAIAFSMNLLDGGIPAGKGDCSSSQTGGRGLLYEGTGACMVTAAQIREWGETLGPAACAMLMWRYDPDFFSRPENVRAFKDLAAMLAKAPARSCRRTS